MPLWRTGMYQHTLERIEASDWAQRFRQASPTSYLDALAVTLETKAVTIEPRYAQEVEEEKEGEGCGTLKESVLWVLLSDKEPDFWLDAHLDPGPLEAVCEEMGWEIRYDMVH